VTCRRIKKGGVARRALRRDRRGRFRRLPSARELSRLAGASTEIVVINLTDHFLYLPLMPQVAGGLVEPRHIRVPPWLCRQLVTEQHEVAEPAEVVDGVVGEHPFAPEAEPHEDVLAVVVLFDDLDDELAQ
jgi:hypothetical protein